MSGIAWLAEHGLCARISVPPPKLPEWHEESDDEDEQPRRKGRPKGSATQPHGYRQQRLLEAITRPITTRELMRALGWSRPVLSSALTSASKAGKIRQVRYAVWERA